MTYAPLGPSVATEIQLMLDEGKTLTSISQTLGVSRDRIRTVMRKYKIEKPDPFSQYSRSEVTEWVKQNIKGIGWAQLAEIVGISKEKMRKYVKHYGFSLSEIKKLKSEHLHDNKTFGYWTVLDGSHKRVNGNAVLTCQCVCGLVKEVSLSNLMGGCTLSCGCKGYEERTSYAWKCRETGKVIGSTKELAVFLSINPLSIYRLLKKGIDTVQDGDYHWDRLAESGKEGAVLGRPWICIETSEVIKGSMFLAKRCNLTEHQINYRGRHRQSVIDAEGNTWSSAA